MIQNFNKFETQFKLKEELLEVTVLLPTPIHGQPALPQSIVGAQSSARSLSWQLTIVYKVCYLRAVHVPGRNPTLKWKFSFVLDKACDERTRPSELWYIEGSVRSSCISSRTNQSFVFCLRFCLRLGTWTGYEIQYFAKSPFMCHFEKEKGNYDKNESFGLLSLSNFLIKNRYLIRRW